MLRDSSTDEEELISTGNDGALRGDGGRRASRCDGLSNLRRFSTCLRDEKKLECRDIDGAGGGGGGGIFSPMNMRQCLG